MEKVKVDLEKEEQRSMEDMWLARIMFSFEKGTLEWNEDTTTVVIAFLLEVRHVHPHLRIFQHEKNIDNNKASSNITED